MAAVTICSDFGAQKNKVCHCFHCFPIYLPWSDRTRCHDLNFLMLSFKVTLSLSSITFIKRLFRSSSLSAIRLVSSTYLRLLIFLPAILIPACASSSLAFYMMYSAYKLNKQSDNIKYNLKKKGGGEWGENMHKTTVFGNTMMVILALSIVYNLPIVWNVPNK